MDNFLTGFAGVGIGFSLFLPSYLFTRQAVEGGGLASAPLEFKIPMFLGMSVMLFSPLIFWGLAPAKDHLLGNNSVEHDSGENKE